MLSQGDRRKDCFATGPDQVNNKDVFITEVVLRPSTKVLIEANAQPANLVHPNDHFVGGGSR